MNLLKDAISVGIAHHTIKEGRNLGTAASTLVGATGGITGLGPIAGVYQSVSQNDAEGKSGTMNMGRHIKRGVLGAIPIVGAVSNYKAAKSRYDAEDKKKFKQKVKEALKKD